MEIEVNTKEKLNVATVSTHIKVRDRFTASFKNADGKEVLDYDGYVPGFFPGQHYGDYLYLDINIETGQILNWIKPSVDDLQSLFNVEEE